MLGLHAPARYPDANMKLYLMQHGEAEAADVDPERPLSERGRRDVEAMAALLAASGLLAVGKAEPIEGIRPNDSVEAFISDADVWEQDTLVVGHLPFMARLVARLMLRDPQREVVDYRPGSVVCLERRDADAWVLAWMIRPDVLARVADEA